MKIPDRPRQLTVVSYDDRSVSLDWTAPESNFHLVKGYQVQYTRKDQQGNYQTVKKCNSVTM